jgi:hypothetical protein
LCRGLGFGSFGNEPDFAAVARHNKCRSNIHFADGVLTRRARIPLEHLAATDALEKLKAAIAWLIKQVNAEFET